MQRYIIATIKSWNIDNFNKLKTKFGDNKFIMIDSPDDLMLEFVESVNPDFIFFPHWSWIIPEEIYSKFNCVVFHMTDLPFGRGGSPLQNLLVRGIYNTKISAIKVCAGIDAGPVYFKEDLDISKGNADEILRNASNIIFDKMIPRFLNEELTPQEQEGEIEIFKRRTPEQSRIPENISSRQLYDFIRMLDGEGYPAAYSMHGEQRIEYTDACLEGNRVFAKAHFIVG